MIVACYHPLPLSACMLNFDLVSILFGLSIPTSFNILLKKFELKKKEDEQSAFLQFSENQGSVAIFY